MPTTTRNTTTRRRPDGTLTTVRPHEVTVRTATKVAPPQAAPAPARTLTPAVGPNLDPMTGRPTGDCPPEVWAEQADLWAARADDARSGGFSDRVNEALFRRRSEICRAGGTAEFTVLLKPNGHMANATPIETYEGPKWAVYPASDTAREGKPRFIDPYGGDHATKGWRVQTRKAPAWAEVVLSPTTQTALLRTYPVD